MYLTSIEKITKYDVIPTMNNPIRVHVSDMEYYICKYNRHSARAYRLYKEYLIAAFLPIWGFYNSIYSPIQIQEKHLDESLGIDRRYFLQPCFGSQVIPNSNEIDKHNTSTISKSKNKAELKDHLLKLSFFDNWICNEDRSHNNYNILYIVESGRYKLYPIDHEACFNHQELKGQLTPITLEDSLIYSELFQKLFKSTELRSVKKIQNLREFSYLCTLKCKELTPEILSLMPPEWGIDLIQEEDFLNQFLFSDEWFEASWHNFIQLIQLS